MTKSVNQYPPLARSIENNLWHLSTPFALPLPLTISFDNTTAIESPKLFLNSYVLVNTGATRCSGRGWPRVYLRVIPLSTPFVTRVLKFLLRVPPVLVAVHPESCKPTLITWMPPLSCLRAMPAQIVFIYIFIPLLYNITECRYIFYIFTTVLLLQNSIFCEPNCFVPYSLKSNELNVGAWIDFWKYFSHHRFYVFMLEWNVSHYFTSNKFVELLVSQNTFWVSLVWYWYMPSSEFVALAAQ